MDPTVPKVAVPIALERKAEHHVTDPTTLAQPHEVAKGMELDFSYDVDSEGLYEEDVDSDDDDGEDDEDLKEAIQEANNAFSEEEVGMMMGYLREKGMVDWMKEFVVERQIPVKKLLMAFGIVLPKAVSEATPDLMLMNVLKVTLTRILRRRERLTQYNTVDDVLNLLRSSSRIIVLSGAGISVSCGIPDFRSSTGLYAMLNQEGKYQLDDPQQMFDIGYFRENPEVFYSFASQIYPSNFVPSPCHRFIKTLEEKNVLLRNYTQNIDTLETIMGVQRVLQCHGSFATASCIQCKRQVEGSEIKDAIFAKEVPYCKVCEAGVPPKKPVPKKAKKKNKAKPWDNDDSDGDDVDGIPSRQKGIMKPDITFFGEPLTDRFHSLLHEDRQATDLLLVIGTSLKVAPVSEILTHLPHSVPQILINKTPVTHVNPDVILLGDADEIVKYICKQLDWELAPLPESLAKFSQQQNTKKRELEQGEPRRVGNSHVWLFDGAEGGKWIERMQANAGGQVDDSSKTDTPPVSENSRPTTSRTSSAGLGGESDATRETKKARKK